MTITTPALRCANSVMAADATHSKIVLLDTGNYPAYSNFLNETWTFASGQWTNTGTTLIDAAGPLPGRVNGVMAWDGTNTMLFGGQGDSSTTGVFQDTWVYNGTTWSKLTPATIPFGRYNGQAAYVGSNKVVMFGGENLLYQAEETWLWDGSAQTWTQVTVANGAGPAARIDSVMAGDATTKAILFGGQGTNSQFNDTWSYTVAAGWTKLAPTTSPSVRSNACMSWDSTNSVFVMFGGKDEYNYLDETWTCTTAGVWTKVAVANGAGPSGRVGAQMAWDSTSNKTIMFGGVNATDNMASNETWSFDGGALAWTKL